MGRTLSHTLRGRAGRAHGPQALTQLSPGHLQALRTREELGLLRHQGQWPKAPLGDPETDGSERAWEARSSGSLRCPSALLSDSGQVPSSPPLTSGGRAELPSCSRLAQRPGPWT